jgi:hypothetical protein
LVKEQGAGSPQVETTAVLEIVEAESLEVEKADSQVCSGLQLEMEVVVRVRSQGCSKTESQVEKLMVESW